jgi:hypothetical protein
MTSNSGQSINRAQRIKDGRMKIKPERFLVRSMGLYLRLRSVRSGFFIGFLISYGLDLSGLRH